MADKDEGRSVEDELEDLREEVMFLKVNMDGLERAFWWMFENLDTSEWSERKFPENKFGEFWCGSIPPLRRGGGQRREEGGGDGE